MALLKKLLNLLPFDGDKTKLGTVLVVVTLIEEFLKSPGVVEALQQLFTSGQGVTAIVITLVGLFHKFLKAKKGKK